MYSASRRCWKNVFIAYSAAKRGFERRSAPLSSLSRPEPGLRPALHLLNFLLLIFRNFRREFFQLRMRCFLFGLLRHLDPYVMMLRHHLQERLVEIGVMFFAQHRRVHFHLFVSRFVRDFFWRSFEPVVQPFRHLLDFLLLGRDHFLREFPKLLAFGVIASKLGHLESAAMMLDHLLQKALLEFRAFERFERSIHWIGFSVRIVGKCARCRD